MSDYYFTATKRRWEGSSNAVQFKNPPHTHTHVRANVRARPRAHTHAHTHTHTYTHTHTHTHTHTLQRYKGIEVEAERGRERKRRVLSPKQLCLRHSPFPTVILEVELTHVIIMHISLSGEEKQTTLSDPSPSCSLLSPCGARKTTPHALVHQDLVTSNHHHTIRTTWQNWLAAIKG